MVSWWCWCNCVPAAAPQPLPSHLAQVSSLRSNAFARHQWQREQGLPQLVGSVGLGMLWMPL